MLVHVFNPQERENVIKVAKSHNLLVESHPNIPFAVYIYQETEKPAPPDYNIQRNINSHKAVVTAPKTMVNKQKIAEINARAATTANIVSDINNNAKQIPNDDKLEPFLKELETKKIRNVVFDNKNKNRLKHHYRNKNNQQVNVLNAHSIPIPANVSNSLTVKQVADFYNIPPPKTPKRIAILEFQEYLYPVSSFTATIFPSVIAVGGTNGIISTLLTVTVVTTFATGQEITGQGISAGTYIVSGGTSTTFVMNVASLIPNTTVITGQPTLFLNSNASPGFAIGLTVGGANVIPTVIISYVQGTFGDTGSTYTLDINQSVGFELMGAYVPNSQPSPTAPIEGWYGGYFEKDLNFYWSSVLNIPILRYPKVSAISVDGNINLPGYSLTSDLETALDIEIIGGLSPTSFIDVYFAPNTDLGFYNAVGSAIFSANGTSSISISYGYPESVWLLPAMQAINQLISLGSQMGITTFAAAGDLGASDGLTAGTFQVDYPASSPFCVSCGGTSINTELKFIDNFNERERVWSYTGGGFSSMFAPHAYQYDILQTQFPTGSLLGPYNNKRAIPDVSSSADPEVGYIIVYNGIFYALGGTSASAPMWAALWANIGEMQYASPILYKAYLRNIFNDITTGYNYILISQLSSIPPLPNPLLRTAFHARVGYDVASGLGTPHGLKLQEFVKSYIANNGNI
jgi:hypothetical protein